MKSSKSQRKATRNHRHRAATRGLLRVEVQARKADAELIKALARDLRTASPKAKHLRRTVAQALSEPERPSVLEIFGSNLPDSAFEGVFEQPRERKWRKLDL